MMQLVMGATTLISFIVTSLIYYGEGSWEYSAFLSTISAVIYVGERIND